MTTTITQVVALTGAGTTYASPHLTVHDRDGDVDAVIDAINLAGLPPAQWRLTVQIDSAPAIGKGPAQVLTSTSAAGASAVTVTQPFAYVRVKDVENDAAGTITCVIRLEQFNAALGWLPYATGQATVNYAAPAPKKTTLRLGLNAHLYSAEAPAEFWRPALDALADVGAGWTRTSMSWALLESSRGVRDPNLLAMLDAFMTDCGSRGIKVMGLVATAPLWAVTGGIDSPWTYTPRSWLGVPGYGVVNPAFSATQHLAAGMAAPTDWNDYTNFITWLVGRYANGGLAGAGGTALGAIETTNEPYVNTAFTRDGGSGGAMAGTALTTFAAWQQHTYSAVKAANAALPCVAMASAYCDWTLLQNLYNTGQWKGNYDAVSVHPYPVTFKAPLGTRTWSPRYPFGDATSEWHHHPASLGKFIDVMDANNDPAEVWVTEFGQSSGDTATSALQKTAQEQADHVAFMWNLLSRYQRVGGLFMHSIEDKGRNYYGESKDAWDNFGIVRTDHVTRKPAYQAVKSALAAVKAGT